jgi:hypothetical protein
MKTHRRIPKHAAIQSQHGPADVLSLALRANPAGQAARGTIILALALGSVGAAAAATSGHMSADHANLPTATASTTASHGPIINISAPWIY